MSVSLASAFPEGVFTKDCPTRVVLDHVMSKWAPLILAALSDGDALRWSELRRRTEGISEKMLAQTLRQLEVDGLVRRNARPVVPPHVDYTLTPLGAGLVEKLLPLLDWVLANAGEILGEPLVPPSR